MRGQGPLANAPCAKSPTAPTQPSAHRPGTMRMARSYAPRRFARPSRRVSTSAREVLDRAIEDFVAAGANPGDRRKHRNVGHEAETLEWTAVGMSHVVTCEHEPETAGQEQRRHVAV